MAYASFSVVFGEQPSAAKWNILGTNDASFNNGTGISALTIGSVTAVKNDYKFRTSRNAAANSGAGAFTVIAFDTEQYDTGNNVASGVFTAPIAGFYQFNWRTAETTSGAETFIASLFKNGTEISRGGQATLTSLVLSSSGSDLLKLSTSDTIDVRSFGTAARALSVGDTISTYFSGFLVSAT